MTKDWLIWYGMVGQTLVLACDSWLRGKPLDFLDLAGRALFLAAFFVLAGLGYRVWSRWRIRIERRQP